MENNEKENVYLYPVEELDKIIEQIDEGFDVMYNSTIMMEVELRRKEIAKKMFATDDEEDIEELRIKHQEQLREHMKQQAKKARRTDVIIIDIPEDKKRELREQCSESYVRPNPNTIYNMTEDQIYDNAEKKFILDKLSRIRRAYFRPEEFRAAIEVIRTAIEYSLEHDYPWMTKEEAIKQFNEGHISFTFCTVPKLYLNYKSEVKDPMILSGVISGSVELVDKNKDFEQRSYADSPLTPISGHIIPVDDHERYQQLHRQGYFTPISPIITGRNTIYNRYRPVSVKQNNQYNGFCNKQGEAIGFDWTQDNAHDKYRRIIKNRPYDISEMMKDINAKNNGINPQISSNMMQYISAINSSSLTAEDSAYTKAADGYKKQTDEVIKMEQNILEKIQMNNLMK